MAKITKDIRVDMLANGEPFHIVLRMLTNEEFNHFQQSFDIDEMFDRTVLNIVDLEDEGGVITVDRKEAIPAIVKSIAVRKLLEVFRIDPKNSLRISG